MSWAQAPVAAVVVVIYAMVITARAEPLRIITPTTTVPNATAAASGNATAVGTNLAAAAAIPAVLDPVAAAEAATALPPPADPHQLLRTINTTDPTSPHYPMWQGAMQYLTAMAANASFQTQDTATAAAKGFVVRNGTQLYRHGKPFYFVGGNAYWIVDFYTMSWGRDKIDEFFDSCQALGIHVIRTWIFNIGIPKSRATYDSRELAGLDYLIWTAKQHGLMLVFTLGNSWNAYKGPEEFVQMATGTSEKKDILYFYSDPATRALYKLHIWGLISRVNPLTGLAPKDDPTIISWNILNEPRCPGCMQADQQLTHQAWLSDMAQFLRAADPLHLISAATEGFFVEDPHTLLHFYNPGPGAQCDGEDWFKISTIPEIDYTTIHVYERHMELLPRPSANPNWPDWIFCGWECYVNWFKNYVGLHKFLSHSVLKKPLVVEEFGLTYFRMTLPQQRVLFKVLLDMLTESAQTDGGLSGTMFWNAARNDSVDSDGYNIQIDRPAYTLSASAIPAPTDLPSTVVSPALAKEWAANTTYRDSTNVVFTSEGAPPGLAVQMTEVLLPQPVLPEPAVAVPIVPASTVLSQPTTAAVITVSQGPTAVAGVKPSAASAEAAAVPVSTSVSTEPLLAAAPSTTAATITSVDSVTPAATAATSDAAAAAAVSSTGIPTSIIPGFTSSQEVVSASAVGRKLLKDTITPMQQSEQRKKATTTKAINPSSSSSSSSSNGQRHLLVVQDHLDAFRRAGWREVCAEQAAKTWRPYKLFNISDTVSNNPMYDELLAGGDVVGVISETTSKLHQLSQGQTPVVQAAGRR